MQVFFCVAGCVATIIVCCITYGYRVTCTFGNSIELVEISAITELSLLSRRGHFVGNTHKRMLENVPSERLV